VSPGLHVIGQVLTDEEGIRKNTVAPGASKINSSIWGIVGTKVGRWTKRGMKEMSKKGSDEAQGIMKLRR